MNVTLIAAVIAACASLLNIWLQIRNARKIESFKFHTSTHARLVEERKKLLDLNYPESIINIPLIIGNKAEAKIYENYLDRMIDATEEHQKFINPLLDAFDADIREVLDHWIRDFESCRYSYGWRTYSSEEERLMALREVACCCHVLVDAIHKGMLTQIDRLSDNLSFRRRRNSDYTHHCFDDAFFISPNVRRVFNPEWRDFP